MADRYESFLITCPSDQEQTVQALLGTERFQPTILAIGTNTDTPDAIVADRDQERVLDLPPDAFVGWGRFWPLFLELGPDREFRVGFRCGTTGVTDTPITVYYELMEQESG